MKFTAGGQSVRLTLVPPEPPQGEPEPPLLPCLGSCDGLPAPPNSLGLWPIARVLSCAPCTHGQPPPPPSSPRLPHLNGEVDEAADAEGVLHEVEDELHVLHQRQVVGHAEGEARDLLQNVPGDLTRAVGVSWGWRGGGEGWWWEGMTPGGLACLGGRRGKGNGTGCQSAGKGWLRPAPAP